MVLPRPVKFYSFKINVSCSTRAKNNCQKSPQPSPSTCHLVLLSLATPLSDPREQQVVVRAWSLESDCLQGPEELRNAQGLGVAWGGGERPCLCPWAPVSQMAPRNLRWLPTQSIPLQTLFEDWKALLIHRTSDPDPIPSSTNKSSKPCGRTGRGHAGPGEARQP